MTTQDMPQAEYEEILKENTDKYNQELEVYMEKKDQLAELERQSFALLRVLYQNLKNGTVVDDSEYNACLRDLASSKDEVYETSAKCLSLLQKVRNLQNNYLVSIINGLQAQLKELQEKGPRTDNLL